MTKIKLMVIKYEKHHPEGEKNYDVFTMCVCVFSSHLFWTSSSLDVPADGVTQEEGHT